MPFPRLMFAEAYQYGEEVARLFTHEHQSRLKRALAEHGLSAQVPQVARPAPGCRTP